MSTWTPGVVPGRNPNVRIGGDRVPTKIHYSPGIVLYNREGTKFKESKSIPGPGVARNFYDTVTASLEHLKTLPTGAEMLNEIDSSGHVLQIFKGPDNWADGSCVVPYPGDIGSSEGRFIKPLRSPAKIKTEAKASAGVWVSPSQTYSRELKRLLDRAGQKNPALTRPVIARLMGVPPNWISDYETGKRALEDDEYYRLVLYLYDYLSPGVGTDGEMRVVLTQANTEDPIWIIIGHELVHAWRIMTGHRVFEGGWEEEAMTTGIPPFTRIKFSENKLRVDGKLTPRPNYNSGLCKTGLLQCVRYLNVQPAKHDRPFAEKDIIQGKPK